MESSLFIGLGSDTNTTHAWRGKESCSISNVGLRIIEEILHASTMMAVLMDIV
jgi:hypothetical protein